MTPASNKLSDVKNWLFQQLENEAREKTQLVRLLLEDGVGLDRETLILGDKRLSESEIMFLQSAITRLRNNEPVQYITTICFFHELKLKIDNRALIPRPETEELVELALAKLSDHAGNPFILDACSGSGCIALAIKNKLPNAKVVGVEKSKDAINLSRENSAMNVLDVEWWHEDLFEDDWVTRIEGCLDLLVSNPPYIPLKDKKEMHSRVLDHEPEMALFVPNEEPLQFYARLSDLSLKSLKKGGTLVCETHETYADEVAALFVKKGLKFVEVQDDLQGKKRMVCGTK